MLNFELANTVFVPFRARSSNFRNYFKNIFWILVFLYESSIAFCTSACVAETSSLALRKVSCIAPVTACNLDCIKLIKI